MAPTNLSTVKRQFEEAQDELRVLKIKKLNSRAALAKAPKISELLVPLLVGMPPETEIVTIHGGLLPEKTKDFLSARKDDRYGVFFILEDQVPEILKLYRLYTYTGMVYSHSDEDRKDAVAELNGDREWVTLAHLYFLGKTLKDERFTNKVIDAFVEEVEEDPKERNYPTGIAGEVYMNTELGDLLRKLIVDLHVWVGHGKGIDEPNDDAHGPAEFLRNVLTGMRVNARATHVEDADPPWETSLCRNYHQHKDTPTCAYEEAESAEVIDLTEARRQCCEMFEQGLPESLLCEGLREEPEPMCD